jgi:nitrate reductase delta subunit
MHPLESLAALFEYPDETYVERCRSAGGHALADALEKLSVTESQELFVATFDWNPATSLDLGWHLYGEQYARGEFLVKMREEMRRYGVAETSELPDHITNVLRLVARMDPEAALKLVREHVAPAVAKLVAALDQKKTPFALLARAVRNTLPAKAPIPELKVELPVLVGD